MDSAQLFDNFFFKEGSFEDPDPLVDADELDRALELKSMQSYPDDETIERIPRGHLDWIYQENSRLAKRMMICGKRIICMFSGRLS